MRLVDCHQSHVQELIAYQRKVLDALGIRHGPTHGEVILTTTGPCLVEVGARAQGAEGMFMKVEDACFGYNQVVMTVDAYVNRDNFAAYPPVPPSLRQHGCTLFLVSFVEGKLRSLPHVETVRALPSFIQFSMLPNVGDPIKITVDCFSQCGAIQMAHENADVLQADYDHVHSLMNTFFDVVK